MHERSVARGAGLRGRASGAYATPGQVYHAGPLTPDKIGVVLPGCTT